MKREQLEHILRSAANITAEPELLIIGSQSVLGSWHDEDLPPEAIRSIEADVVAPDGDVERTDRIDGALGEGSLFHQTYGIYAQGVGLTTAVLPDGWRDRLVTLESENSKPGRGLCLEPHDCVLSKMVAGRQKDYDFADALLKARLLDPNTLAARVKLLDITDAAKTEIRTWLRGQRRRGRRKVVKRSRAT